MTLLSKENVWLLFIFLIVSVLSIGIVVYSFLNDDVSEPVVKTELGMIRGMRADDGDYFMYLGVPYGAINASNVFGPAIRQQFTWKINANDDSYTCPQYDFINKKSINGTLNCLRLNIYTPLSANPNNLRPVLIFIPGYQHLSVKYEKRFLGPKFLMKQDIILVVINYRVGPYGFLCVDHPEFSGNQGLKDQILAFEWIKENIKHFGGDPARLTLAGGGSGGESVNLHLLYGKEEFQHVIIDSGIHKEPVVNHENNNRSVAIVLAKQLGCQTHNEIEALEFLNSKHPVDVIDASMKLKIKYHPCVETKREDSFLTKSQLKSFSIHLKRTPILITQSEIEATGDYYLQDLDKAYNNVFLNAINGSFKFEDEETLKRMEEYVRKFYLGEKKIDDKMKNEIIRFWTDIYTNYPTKRMIKKYIENGSNDIYYGVFSYPGIRSFEKILYNIDVQKALSGDVYGYLFDVPLFKKTLNSEEERVINIVTTLWANFVKYSNPTPKRTKTISIKWQPVEYQKLNFMNISTILKMQTVPYHSRTAFWDLFSLKNNLKHTKHMIEPWI